MIKKIAFAVLTIATLASGSVNAGPLMPGLEDRVLINRPAPSNGFSTICYGCRSERTGLPRTEYVRPHFNSGRYVGGYYRSRR